MGVGSVFKNGTAFTYELGSYKKIFDTLIFFFSKYPIPTCSIKATNYSIWKKIIETLIFGDHLTDKGKLIIHNFILDLNKQTKKRGG